MNTAQRYKASMYHTLQKMIKKVQHPFAVVIVIIHLSHTLRMNVL